MKYRYFAAAAVAAAFASPAAAQVVPSGGPYIGVIAGVDEVTVDDGFTEDDASDIVYGAVVGYDVAFASAFVGIEGEIAQSEAGAQILDFAEDGDSLAVKSDVDYYVGARAGFSVLPRVRAYGKLGYSWTGFEATYDDGDVVIIDDRQVEGLRYGAGVEVDLPFDVALRGEYRRTDYGDLEVFGAETGAEADRGQFVVGALLKF